MKNATAFLLIPFVHWVFQFTKINGRIKQRDRQYPYALFTLILITHE